MIAPSVAGGIGARESALFWESLDMFWPIITTALSVALCAGYAQAAEPRSPAATITAEPALDYHPVRLPAARAAFVKANPCPATGKSRGACPGYVVEHIKPLCAGGADHHSNMQWKTKAEAAIKDREERRQCAATSAKTARKPK